MPADPIVQAIRRVRHAHAEQFGNDLAAIAADLERLQRQSGRTYVNFPPQRPTQAEIDAARERLQRPDQ